MALALWAGRILHKFIIAISHLRSCLLLYIYSKHKSDQSALQAEGYFIHLAISLLPVCYCTFTRLTQAQSDLPIVILLELTPYHMYMYLASEVPTCSHSIKKLYTCIHNAIIA